ncbi:MAG: hypothetical protein HQM14_14595 [SAR324 cluster bacterium]|nr:hypothetical protein [SAR324 cluster bacterium]
MTKTCYKKKILMIGLSFFMLLTTNLSGQTIKIHHLTSEPVLDGLDSDWKGLSEVLIPLKKETSAFEDSVKELYIKGGVFGDSVYFFIRWQDETHDIVHKPFVWDQQKNKYVNGPQREDRLAIQFEMTGNYTTDWLSGNNFKADMWHWKASRSNPIGLVHDKMTTVSSLKMLRSYKTQDRQGKDIYFFRPSDKGSQLYITKRYRKKQQNLMPKYIINKEPHGSVADIKAKGIWTNKSWYLELKRKLNTGNADDVIFVKGKAIKGGIAVFNHSENDQHTISETLIFQF